MKKSDFYEITLRILGIVTAVQAVGVVKDLIYVISTLVMSQRGNFGIQYGFSLLVGPTLQAAVIIAIAAILLLKAKEIVRFFVKAEPDEKFSLLSDHRSVLEVAVIVTGGVIFIENLFLFIQEISFVFMDMKTVNNHIATSSKVMLFIIGLKAFIGYCLIFVARRITSYLLKKQKEDNPEEEVNQS